MSLAELPPAMKRKLRDAAIAELARRQAEKAMRGELENSLSDFHRTAWPWLDPAKYLHNWSTDAMAEHLEAVTYGYIRNLIITIPPRMMKSLMVSCSWPAWVWTQSEIGPNSGPQVKFMNISYDPKLSIRDAIKMKRLINSAWYQDKWSDRFHIMPDKDQNAMFENSAGGFRFSTSVNGTITGEGADCFVAGTLVATPNGDIPIEQLNPGDVIYSFDTLLEKVLISHVEHTRERWSDDLCEISTNVGTRVRCTADHRIFTPGRGFVRAESLGQGERLVFASPNGSCHANSPELRRLRGADRAQGVRVAQGDDARFFSRVLHRRLQARAFFREAHQAVRDLFQVSAQTWAEILFNGMHVGGPRGAEEKTQMPRMWLRFHRAAASVLFAYLRRSSALQANAWGGQLALQAPGILFQSIPQHGPAYQGARSIQVCSMRSTGQAGLQEAPAVDFADTSFERRYTPQCAGEPSGVVLGMSQETPSWDFATVASVSRHRGRGERVYDIQVAGCHNFFANGILSHNCIVVDDPLNAKKAQWQSALDNVNSWADEALPLRYNNQKTGARVIIMQRLHDDDLVGHELAKEQEDCVHLNLPMEFVPGLDTRTWINGNVFFEDPRTEEDELLWEERFPRTEIERLRIELGPFAYAAQMQQEPVPRGGGIIDRLWWQVWPAKGYEAPKGQVQTFPPCSLIVGSVDTAYGEKDVDAWNAMTVWGVWSDQRERPKVVLMEGWRKRVPLRGVIPKGALTDEERKPHWGLAEFVADTVRRRRIDVLLIENKTRGGDLAAELYRLFRAGECQIIMIEPQGDKVARLHSVQPMFADEMIYAPEKAWAEAVINEVSQFPKSKWKDYVDTASQALSWLRKSGALMLGTEADEDNLRRNTFRSQKPAAYDV